MARRRLLGEVSGGCPIRRPDGGSGGARREAGVWWPFSGGRSSEKNGRHKEMKLG